MKPNVRTLTCYTSKNLRFDPYTKESKEIETDIQIDNLCVFSEAEEKSCWGNQTWRQTESPGCWMVGWMLGSPGCWGLLDAEQWASLSLICIDFQVLTPLKTCLQLTSIQHLCHSIFLAPFPRGQ